MLRGFGGHIFLQLVCCSVSCKPTTLRVLRASQHNVWYARATKWRKVRMLRGPVIRTTFSCNLSVAGELRSAQLTAHPYQKPKRRACVHTVATPPSPSFSPPPLPCVPLNPRYLPTGQCNSHQSDSWFSPFHSQDWSISNFPCCLTRTITSQSMENLAFHSLRQMNDDFILPILTT